MATSKRRARPRKSTGKKRAKGRSKGATPRAQQAGGDPPKKTGKKRATRSSGEAASKKVGSAMHQMKRGKLVSGSSKKKVTSRKQAVAIGLSQARKRGAKVPSRRAGR